MYYPTSIQIPRPAFEYRVSPQVPAYHSVKYPVYTPTPPRPDGRNHSRRASHSPVSYSYTDSQQFPSYFAPPQFTYESPVTYTTKYAVPKQQRADFAATKEHVKSKAERSPRHVLPKGYTRATPSKKQASSSRAQKVRVAAAEESDEYAYNTEGSPPPPYNEDSYYHSYPVDHVNYVQGATYKQVQPPTYRTRARAASHPGPKPQRLHSTKQKSQKVPKPPLVATAEDALRAGIPAGYSYKNWDPSQTPIFLLGSVFDANSLGKWIFDWTVYHHGPSAPISDLAGELWVSLIELSSRIKRAEESLPRIRNLEDRDFVEDFLEGGERLWDRLGKILKACEDYMWRAAKKDEGGKRVVAMGPKSGCEFVDSMFGRDRKLEETEKFMTRVRHWLMRFETCCEDILRHPRG